MDLQSDSEESIKTKISSLNCIHYVFETQLAIKSVKKLFYTFDSQLSPTSEPSGACRAPSIPCKIMPKFQI
jgi:hypothetical protein